MAWVAALATLAVHSTRFRRLNLVLIASLAALLSLWIFVDALSGNGIDYAVIYHLRAGMQGAGVGDFSSSIFIIVVVLLCCLALPLLPRVQRFATWRFAGPAFAVIFLSSTVLNPLTGDMATFVRQERTTALDPEIGNGYIRPSGALAERRNLVILYAESLERTYLDESLFPGLTPQLNRLRRNAVDFTQVASREGGTWTIAGMVSSLCGVPLALSNDANGYSSIGSFMPGARCLSDHLRDLGYSLEFVGGAALEFAGKGRFLANHGFSTVRDREYFRGMNLGENRFSPWGVHDDVLLDTMWQRFSELSSESEPFALVGLTLDTHHPSGHIPHACLDVAYEKLGQRRPMLDAIQCSDRLIAEFVRRIRASRFSKNTIVVVASDHIALPNDVSDLLRRADRRNLLLVFDDELRPRRIDRATSTLDTGATVLDALGGGVALGFGRSQLSVKGADTSLTALPEEGEEDRLGSYIAFSRSLWMLGTVKDHVQLKGGAIRLGKQELTPPLSITADSQGHITTLGTAGIRAPGRGSGTASDTLYIDRCFAFGDKESPDDWCLWGAVDGNPRVAGQKALEAGAPIPDLLQHARAAAPAEQLRNDFIIKQHFDSSNTVVGHAGDGSLFSQFSDGVLAYGPYEDVCAGSYQLTLTGKAAPAANAWVDIVSDYGANAFDRYELQDSGEADTGVIASAPYVFSDDLSVGEVRVGVTPQAVVRLDGYTLLPHFQAVHPGQQIDFRADGEGARYLSCGWSPASENGREIRADAASLRFNLPAVNEVPGLEMHLVTGSPQRVQVLGNDQLLTTLDVAPGAHAYPIDLPAIHDHVGQLTLTLVPERGTCQESAGGSHACTLNLSRLDVMSPQTEGSTLARLPD